MKDILIELEKNLKNFLQKNVKFVLDDKPLKSGKFIIFSQNNYHIHFLLKNKNKNVNYKIPIPFDLEVKSDRIIFNYKISNFTKNNKKIEQLLSKISRKQYSKLYNKNLELVDESKQL